MTSTAVITTVHNRVDHLAGMRRGLARQRPARRPQDVQHVIVRMGGADPWNGVPDGPPVVRVEMSLPSGSDADPLPLAAARNAGAAATDANLLIFLDVDCIPSPRLIARYRWAARQRRGLLAGPVGYLPETAGGPPDSAADLRRLAVPHPARPVPPDCTVLPEDRYELFWSLSFAISRTDYAALGGFCEDYVGYGGEDTDLAFTARKQGMPFCWVGGAWAWHQHHQVEDPPYGHLTDIVRNARVFHRRWGTWPMEGWLTAFATHRLIDWDSEGDTLRLIGDAAGAKLS